MSAGRIPVTVAVPVKNEEANLPRCLERLGRFAEVIVIDSGSTDATPEIAHRFGARLVDFKWNGRYPKKRNWLLMNETLSQDWVLFLDADEFVDDDFCDAVAAAVQETDKVGFWLNYDIYFMGRRLRYGVAQRKLALFRVGAGLYEKIEEVAWSRLDMEIHEHPILDGPIGEISARIDHRDDRGLAKFVDRHRDYALWEARRFRTLQSAERDVWARLTVRQKFKYRNLHRSWYPSFYFWFNYLVKLGFLDGGPGYYHSYYKAWYFRTIRLLIREQAGSA